MKTYYISRKTYRDFSVFLTLQTIFKEQKKRSRGRKMRWEKKRKMNKRKTKRSTSVRGTYAATKRCRAKHLLSQKMQIRDLTSAADSSSLQPRLHSEHTRCKQSVQSVCECVDRIHKRSLCCISTCTNHNLFVLWDASYYLSDLRFHYWRAENPTRDLTFAHRAADAPARVRSAESAVYVKPDTSVSSYYPSHLSPLPSSSLLYNPLLICAPPRTVCCQ